MDTKIRDKQSREQKYDREKLIKPKVFLKDKKINKPLTRQTKKKSSLKLLLQMKVVALLPIQQK